MNQIFSFPRRRFLALSKILTAVLGCSLTIFCSFLSHAVSSDVADSWYIDHRSRAKASMLPLVLIAKGESQIGELRLEELIEDVNQVSIHKVAPDIIKDLCPDSTRSAGCNFEFAQSIFMNSSQGVHSPITEELLLLHEVLGAKGWDDDNYQIVGLLYLHLINHKLQSSLLTELLSDLDFTVVRRSKLNWNDTLLAAGGRGRGGGPGPRGRSNDNSGGGTGGGKGGDRIGLEIKIHLLLGTLKQTDQELMKINIKRVLLAKIEAGREVVDCKKEPDCTDPYQEKYAVLRSSDGIIRVPKYVWLVEKGKQISGQLSERQKNILKLTWSLIESGE